jgi:hypothetical protein
MEKVDLCFIGAGFHATTNIYPAAIGAEDNIFTMALCEKIIKAF